MEAGMKVYSEEIKLIDKYVIDKRKLVYVERELYAGEDLVYKDRISARMFCFNTKHPDTLMALKLFCAGDHGLYIGDHATGRRKGRNHFVELLQFVRFQLKAQKLNFGIKFFKLRQKYKFLRFKSSP